MKGFLSFTLTAVSLVGAAMLAVLHHIENYVLPRLLVGASLWKSLYVDYHPPFVQRLWTAVDVDGTSYRIYLHRIPPCEARDALFHTHPWPSVMRILSGRYTMTVGYGAGNVEPAVAMTLSLPAGASYEMVNEDAWHAVCPEGEPAYSLMVTGAPWGRESPKSPYQLEPLALNLQSEILAFFHAAYPAAPA